MGFFSTISSWLRPAVRVVKKVIDTVNDWVNGTSISEDYYEYIKKNSFINQASPTRHEPEQEPKRYSRTPNFWEGDVLQSRTESSFSSRIGEVEKKLDQQTVRQLTINKKLALQTEFMRLAMSAHAFDRYTNNIQLHASNLSIHLHTLKNVKGLTDDVNQIRFGLKRSMGTINHIANIINTAGLGNVNKLEGINIEINDGAISINAAYRAFERTRNLLIQEIIAVSELADEHAADVYRVKHQASELGSLGSDIIHFLDNQVLPKIHRTKEIGLLIKNQIGELPVIPENP